PNVSFNWSSSDATTASVSVTGLVSGLTRGGPVTITARSSEGLTGTASVRVVQWVSVASPTTQPLYAVWGAAPNDVWAVGEYGTVLHYDGTGWSTYPISTAK